MRIRDRTAGMCGILHMRTVLVRTSARMYYSHVQHYMR